MSDIYEAELLTEVVNGSGGVELLPATSTRLGGIKVGTNLTITEDGILSASASGGVELLPATSTRLGGIKVGTNLTITEDGILSASASGGGVTAEVKTALLNCFANVAWINENGQSYYNALQTALNNAGTSTGGGSGSGDSGDSGSGESGGDSGGEVTPPSGGDITPPEDLPDPTAWQDGVPYEPTIIDGEYVDNTNGTFTAFAGWSRTGYLPCMGASQIAWSNIARVSSYNAFYDAGRNFISSFKLVTTPGRLFVEVPANASYVVFSNITYEMQKLVFTPHA